VIQNETEDNAVMREPQHRLGHFSTAVITILQRSWNEAVTHVFLVSSFFAAFFVMSSRDDWTS